MPSGLGRGLGSLIPTKSNGPKINQAKTKLVDSIVHETDAEGEKILKIKPDNIRVNPRQPRQNFSDTALEDLMNSIREHGIIQPLVVSICDEEGCYELIAGERRLRAARAIELDEVPVIIRDADDQQKLEVALIENLQRENLNPIETAIAYSKLMDEFNIGQDEVAKKVGKSRPVISNSIRLLRLPEEIKEALIENRLSEGHAKYLLGLESEAKQMALFRKIVMNNLSVKDTINESRAIGGTKNARIKINYKDKDKEFAFREFFQARCEIKRKGKGGQIIINFFDEEELDNIVDRVK